MRPRRRSAAPTPRRCSVRRRGRIASRGGAACLRTPRTGGPSRALRAPREATRSGSAAPGARGARRPPEKAGGRRRVARAVAGRSPPPDRPSPRGPPRGRPRAATRRASRAGSGTARRARRRSPRSRAARATRPARGPQAAASLPGPVDAAHARSGGLHASLHERVHPRDPNGRQPSPFFSEKEPLWRPPIGRLPR